MDELLTYFRQTLEDAGVEASVFTNADEDTLTVEVDKSNAELVMELLDGRWGPV